MGARTIEIPVRIAEGEDTGSTSFVDGGEMFLMVLPAISGITNTALTYEILDDFGTVVASKADAGLTEQILLPEDLLSGAATLLITARPGFPWTLRVSGSSTEASDILVRPRLYLLTGD